MDRQVMALPNKMVRHYRNIILITTIPDAATFFYLQRQL
jgi:hypothetical protein